MSKKYKFQKHEDVYLTIIKYFEGDILLVKDNIIKDLDNDKYRGETIKPIDSGKNWFCKKTKPTPINSIIKPWYIILFLVLV